MPIKGRLDSEKDVLTQLTGVTGLGWTTSILGYLGTLIGYGNSLAMRLGDPHSLLYLGIGFFIATLGLDRLRDARLRGEE
jgi:hypothetical protein